MIPKEKLKKLFDGKKYEVELFKRNGFSRNKCKVCGSYFWSLNTDLDICGDTACIGGYKFLEEKNNLKKWDFHQTINNWSNFFEIKNHKRINDYPVVARWRDDIYFTIASIADFQPWVLNGTIDPPANPLIVPQPCIRFGGKGFCDIDNVGKTGRHLSLFIMGGQHSFNSKKRKIKGYWMDECIDLNFDFLINNFKLDQDEITYREDIWQGGGNFGPSLEVFYRGLEIVNNVFMQYEIKPDNSYQEMDFKVIDVGWGLERITWLSQNTPTIYDAAFGPVIEKAKKDVDIQIPDKLLKEYSIISGLIDRDGVSLKELPKNHTLNSGYNFLELEKIIDPLQALYAIVDHLRTFVFSLADGAIPSNMGGGYNIRTLLRRVFSLNKIYSFNLDLKKLCYNHINFLKKTYPRIENAIETINEIIDLEIDRYKITIEKGRKYVENLLKKNEKINNGKIREIYESRGIAPEMIKKIAKELNKEIAIPACFYVELSKKEEKVVEIEDQEGRFKDQINELPPTIKLFYENVYAKEFTAKVLKKIVKKYIILDKTLFYPLGGGQIGDTGFINDSKVLRSFKIGDIIIHEVSNADNIKEGENIRGIIDWDNRLNLMRNHTSAHIINQAAREVLGNHIWQAGAEKTAKKGRIDLTHFKSITQDEINKIEKLSNKIVMENRSVNVYNLERGVAEEKYGFRIYQGGAVPGKILRIIEVENWDIEACGGTHVTKTGEIGLIKIINSERIQDGVVRIEYTSGENAITEMQTQEGVLVKISKLLDVPLDQAYNATEKFFKLSKELRKKIKKLQLNSEAGVINYEVISDKYDTKIVLLITESDSIRDLINMGLNIDKRVGQKTISIIFGKGERLNLVLMVPSKISNRIKAGQIIKENLNKYNIKGGGKDDLGQGSAPVDSDIEGITKTIKEIIEKSLEKLY